MLYHTHIRANKCAFKTKKQQNPKFDRFLPNPRIGSSPKLACVIMSRTAPRMPNILAIHLGCSASNYVILLFRHRQGQKVKLMDNFKPEAELTLFLRMRTNEIAKSLENIYR